ncbi:MAG: PD40 domain-containing protein [Acidobacteria bacterium]|nr:PD40 domain-containing protein [Acidobacteriota bacterium]
MTRTLLALFVLAFAASAQTRLLRQPHFHSGSIVFSYQGDIWSVGEDGSNLHRLTTHPARDIAPRYSPDGKWIAFSSNRYGNFDVLVMPAAGGDPKQLTWHSAPDTVVGWSRDGKRILFTSARGDGAFPSVANLYEVPLEGGLETPLPTDWGSFGAWSPDGSKLAFTRHPQAWTRKHYRGSYAADLWLLEASSKTFKDLRDSVFKGNMLWPMYGAKGEIFFVADRLPDEQKIQPGVPAVMASANNIWKVSERGGAWTQVTRYTSGGLASPSLSYDGKTIAYEYNHGLWLLDTASGKSREVQVRITADENQNPMDWKVISSAADSFHLSPSGRRAAIVAHGEIFTVATDRGEPQRVTNSYRRDTAPQWSPNGKWIAYISDESGREEIWLADELGHNRKKLTDADTEKRGVQWAPDSKSMLFSSSDNKLWRLDVDPVKLTEVANGETGAPSNARFAPDGQWVSFVRMDRDNRPHVFVKPAASAPGQDEKLIGVDDLFAAMDARWSPDGKRLYLSAGVMQMGMASLGRSSNLQLYSVNLQKEDKDPLDRGIDTEAEAAAQPQTPAFGGGGRAQQAPAKVEVKIDWDGLPKRIRQLTRLGDAVSQFAVSPDSRQIAFVARGEQENRMVSALWTIQDTGERLTRVAQAQPPSAEEGAPPAPRGMGGFGGGISSPQWSRDGRSLFFMDAQGIYSVSIAPASDSGSGSAQGGGSGFGGGAAMAGGGGGAPPRRRVNFSLRVEVDRAAERAQVFDEGWRIMKNRFYDPKMHGVNWSRAKDDYASLLPYVADTEELQTVMMEMIGELNASHTGVSGGTATDRSLPQTRHPGFELESDSAGLYKVKTIYAKGPADKDFLKLKPGFFVLALNGQDFKSPENYWKLFTLTTARRFEFLVNDKPGKEGAWTIEIEPAPLMAISQLKYQKWVDDRKAMVDKLSNGQIGYLHIQAMDAPSFRKFELDLAENRFKKALIIVQRFNGGGGIDQELLQVLGQRQYQKVQRRNSVMEERPQKAFFGPMAVMQNERSASDAEMFPDGFRRLGLGKLVGVPTMGAVIGTGAYQLLDGSSIRTPGAGVYTAKGENMENYGVQPDVYVDNLPADFLAGKDAQISKAVELLSAEIGKSGK